MGDPGDAEEVGDDGISGAAPPCPGTPCSRAHPMISWTIRKNSARLVF